MPRFTYTAKRGPQDIVEGVLEAENRGIALSQLTELGYVPVRVTEQAATDGQPAAPRPKAVKARRVPSSQLTVFTRQFASLVRSYVPLLRSLHILQGQATHAYFRCVLHEVAEAVRQGDTLSSGLAKFPLVFQPLYVSLVRSGEASGALDAVLDRLARQLEQEEAMRTKIRTAFTYPAFVGVVGCGTVIFLMTFVMPRLARLLEGLGERLPLPTRILLGLTHWMSQGWFWGMILGIAILLALAWRSAGERGKILRDRALLRVPVLGVLVGQIEMARFARSLGLQLHHGIPILQAIEVAVAVVHQRVIRAQLERLPEAMRQGSALSQGLRGLGVGTPFLIDTVEVGEESGKVGEALTEVATYYEQEAERLLQSMATLLEPLLIVGVGVVVGFIVMAVLLPIFEMSSVNL